MNPIATPGGKSACQVGRPLVHDGPIGSTHFNNRTEEEVFDSQVTESKSS